MPSVLKSRPVAACALVVGCAYVAAVLGVHLGTFPSLHADEAWEGLFALRIRASGLYTPHGTNTYTGPWYAWMIAQLFTRGAPGVSALRTIGVAANALAVTLLTWHFWRRCGAARACSWLAVVAAVLTVWMLRDELGAPWRWLLPATLTFTLLAAGHSARRARETLAAATFLAGAALAIAPCILSLLA